jgi:hypothetical protein
VAKRHITTEKFQRKLVPFASCIFCAACHMPPLAAHQTGHEKLVEMKKKKRPGIRLNPTSKKGKINKLFK